MDFRLTRENHEFPQKLARSKYTQKILSPQAIDVVLIATHHFLMARARISLEPRKIHVVGSFGSAKDLISSSPEEVAKGCDIVEIRLDLLAADGLETTAATWERFSPIPLLFTARRKEEGGALALSGDDRMGMLRKILEHAALIDVEVASIQEMAPILTELKDRQIPWIASYHDFTKLPPTSALKEAAEAARKAGAAVFKAAAKMESPQDVARLAEFQLQDHGLPVSTMGMGALAPVSRQLCAQCGSVLNYGYLGDTATAPGQWDSALLKQAISRLTPFHS